MEVSVLRFVLLLADFRHLGSENAPSTATLKQTGKSTAAGGMEGRVTATHGEV